jgi:hypothetical protein
MTKSNGLSKNQGSISPTFSAKIEWQKAQSRALCVNMSMKLTPGKTKRCSLYQLDHVGLLHRGHAAADDAGATAAELDEVVAERVVQGVLETRCPFDNKLVRSVIIGSF